MIFLIEYERHKGEIITLRPFDDSKREQAEQLRLKIELDLRSKNIKHEIVLLDAASEEALRKTHRRYFENAGEIGRSIHDDAA